MRFGRESGRRRYVVGFAFSPNEKRVALILKLRGPDDAAEMVGTWNGIGGQCGASETYIDAMRREFHQEAGPIVADWKLFAISDHAASRVFYFRSTLSASQWRALKTGERSITDEIVNRFDVRRLSTASYDDVKWLVPLALDGRQTAAVRIDYRDL